MAPQVTKHALLSLTTHGNPLPHLPTAALLQSRILETCRQISYEAKEVFYGENYWTFFVSQRIRFYALIFQMEPMVQILPYIRKAHIRFGMFHWILWESCGLTDPGTGSIVKKSLSEICLVLLAAPALRTVKIIWTETYPTWKPTLRQIEVHRMQGLISEILQPLARLPITSDLQKSNIMVAYRNGVRAAEMELDFSESVDEVIALHRSRKVLEVRQHSRQRQL